MSKLEEASGGHNSVQADWMPATGLRALIQEDPVLLWLKFYGEANGFEQDPEEYSFLNWIGQKGRDFEAAFVKNVAPEAVQALAEDKDVGRVDGLKRTLDLMARRVPVITKAALWWGPEKIYGSADIICLTSFLLKTYCVIDCKYSAGLDGSGKKTDLAMNMAQVRLYSFMLGQMQGQMPRYAYLATRDRIHDPLPVAVDHRLNGPLDQALTEMRDLYTHIKLHGDQYLPGRDSIVAPNVGNKKDEPWHLAKKEIISGLPGSPLEKLPQVGTLQARGLRAFGFEYVEDLLCDEGMGFPFEVFAKIGLKAGERIRAVLRANKTGKVVGASGAAVPPLCETELFVDYEFFSNARADFEADWPKLTGCPMIFMIGVYFKRRGQWQFRSFIAEREHPDAERKMFGDFLAFLHQHGVFDPARSAALYHWSPAEISQSSAASKRHGLERLADLPWVDVRKVFANTPIGVPGGWAYGLKEIVRAVGEYAPKYKSPWPEELSSGLGAMVMGWEAYDQPEPLETKEMTTLTDYLEADVKGLWQVLRWLRDEYERPAPITANTGRGGWYALARGG
jgi:hypothetical protein